MISSFAWLHATGSIPSRLALVRLVQADKAGAYFQTFSLTDLQGAAYSFSGRKWEEMETQEW